MIECIRLLEEVMQASATLPLSGTVYEGCTPEKSSNIATRKAC